MRDWDFEKPPATADSVKSSRATRVGRRCVESDPGRRFCDTEPTSPRTFQNVAYTYSRISHSTFAAYVTKNCHGSFHIKIMNILYLSFCTCHSMECF